MSMFKEEMTASEGVYLNMKEFSAYTIESKFPNVIDGLKPIHRRILLTLHKNPHETAKEATVAGRVMEMHPHGDASIEDAIAGLAKPYGNIVPLVDSSSNLGTYDGENPAAARYVDVHHAETAEDLFFRHTEFSSLMFQPCESEKGVEPTNFVPVIPTTLMSPVMGIALGFKTETSAISLENICIVARKFVQMKYKNPDTYRKQALSLAPYLLPDFPTACYLRNSRQIISEYRKGNFDCPFITDGEMSITKNTITISTLPPDKSFNKVTTDFGTRTHLDKTSWEHEHFQEVKDLGDHVRHGTFVCTLRRGENPFELLAQLKKLVQFTSSWKPNPLYYDYGNGMSKETPLSLLDKWSDARFRVVLGGLKQQLISLQEQYRKLMALSIVVDHSKEVCEIFRTSKDKDATVSVLANKFNLSFFQAKFLQKLPLEKLTSRGKQELLDEIEEIKKKNNELQKKFAKIPEEMIADIDYIEKKYAAEYPPNCVVKSFIGTACYKKTGWILVESLNEFDTIAANFGTDDTVFNLFQEHGSVVVVGSDEPDRGVKCDVPKYLHAAYVNRLASKHKCVSVSVKGGCTFVPEPSSPMTTVVDPVPVGDRCTVITLQEGRKVIDVNSSNMRQTHNVVSPSVKGAIFTSPLTDEEVFVVHCNTKVPGIVHIDRISGNRNISRIVIGETVVIGVYRIGVPILFTIPPSVAIRTSIRNVYIEDLAKYVAPNSTLKLMLTRKKTSTEKELVPRAPRSTLFTIKD